MASGSTALDIIGQIDEQGPFQVFKYEGTENIIRLSFREKIIADTYLQHMNKSECEREINRYYKDRKVAFKTVSDILERPNVMAYMAHRIEEVAVANGYTKESWMKDLLDYKNGSKVATKETMSAMKLLALGLKISETVININNIQKVDVRQADGSA